MTTEPHQRLMAARERAGFATASEAARRYGWNENTYRSHENGERGLRPDVAARYAAAFKVSPAYILIGEAYEETVNQSSMNLNGYISQDGAITPPAGGDTAIHSAKIIYLSASFPGHPFAFEVVDDDTIGFLSKGDLVVASNNDIEIGDALNKLCILRVDKEKFYLRHVIKGSEEGSVNIETSPRRPERLCFPTQIKKVKAIFLKGEWGTVPLSSWMLPEN